MLIPEGATTVTVPDRTVITSPESNGCTNSFGGVYPQDLTAGNVMRQRGNFVVTVDAATTTVNAVPRAHQHRRRGGGVATGATGTGFYCGSRYEWSEFERTESRALFKTAARRSLLGWVVGSASGYQYADCVGHRPIFRPDDQ